MQTSVVNYSELNSELRIDAEYYRAEILERLNMLERHNNDSLANLADFIPGPFGSTVTVDKYVESSSYRYIRNKDINDFRINDTAPALIPENVWASLPQFHIFENDLLITVVGTLGKVAIATKEDCRSIFSCKSTILRTKKINPFFLLAYLNSDTGKLFSSRGKRGAIQEGLNLTDLKEIRVLLPSNNTQSLVERVIRLAFACAGQSQEKYQEAQTLLLTELGLVDRLPKHQLTFVKNYSDTQQAGRIDADYFQPKYEEIVQAIKRYPGGWDALGKLLNLKAQNYYPEDKQEYKYIELADIAGNGEITGCMIERGKDLPSRARRRVEIGDVIVSSIEGSLDSIALINEQNDQALCSTGFHVVNSPAFNSETLLVLLKSIAGQLQLRKGCSGTILTAINKDEFGKIALPRIVEEKQAQIQQVVTESFTLRKKSKHLLECSKRAVEIAIEQGEQTAVNWLENETDASV